MTTRSSEADKPFDSTQGHEHCRMASSSLLLTRVATVPRLRLWTQALREIPRRIQIYIRNVALSLPTLCGGILSEEMSDHQVRYAQ